MNLTIKQEGKYSLLRLHDDKLTAVISPELKSEFLVLSAEGTRNIILDLGETSYCDSSGLSAILVGNRLCRNAGGTFVISCLQDGVTRLIIISQLDKVLAISPTVSEAIDLVFMEEIEREMDLE